MPIGPWSNRRRFPSREEIVLADCIATLEQSLTNTRADLLDSQVEVERLLADAEALKTDAERYRWLRVRNEVKGDPDPPGPYAVDDDAEGLPCFVTGSELDDAIDAARKEGSK